jgi:hypothetical protein
MFVIAQDNKPYTRISFNVGPSGQVLIPAEIDYSLDFGPSDQHNWNIEYQANIKAISWFGSDNGKAQSTKVEDIMNDYALPYDFLDEFENMEPAERQFILDELADRPELWNEEEVMRL